ncbi:MAG TPA: hypothetical protein PKM25_08415 [Candidatus Ozemobacteraceae bacterium]|nr:hypothetical protein [Candidatus Ozemobacteraceae bacterium]
MPTTTPVTLRPGLTLDVEKSGQMHADLGIILGASDLDLPGTCFALWQRVQDWTGHAVSRQPVRPLAECMEAVKKEEYPDESSKANLIRAVVFQALEHHLDSATRQGGFSSMFTLICDIARLGWGYGSISISELGDRPIWVSAIPAIELDEIRATADEEVRKRIRRFFNDPGWHGNGALAGSSLPTIYYSLYDLFLRAAAVQMDRKAANQEDMERASGALDRSIGESGARLIRLTGHGFAAMLLDNLLRRPAIVSALARLGSGTSR